MFIEVLFRGSLECDLSFSEPNLTADWQLLTADEQNQYLGWASQPIADWCYKTFIWSIISGLV